MVIGGSAVVLILLIVVILLLNAAPGGHVITPIQLTVPIPSIPMPAWAHQWLIFIIGISTVVSTSISVWGPGFGLSLHVMVLVAGGAASVATLFRAIDAASETVVKNAQLEAIGGSIAVVSTTNRKAVLTNTILPQLTVPGVIAAYPPG